MSRKIIGPFNRVEGDLEVQLEFDGGTVTNAYVVSPLYRGFERILVGKVPEDALVFTPRICGICSVSQSVAAAKALQMAMGVDMPANGRLSHNLVLAAENVADHLTHFYLFFMPDFCRQTYGSEAWFSSIDERFKAVRGTAAKEMLKARAEFMHLLGILAGKWPHSLAIQPGGTTRTIGIQDQIRIIAILSGFRTFLEKTVYGSSLEDFTQLASKDELYTHFSSGAPLQSDFGQFMKVSRELELGQQGHGPELFMSYGVYDEDDSAAFPDGALFRQGTVGGGVYSALDQAAILEDVSHSWMVADSEARHPFEGTTVPDADRAEGYSWCKAPRLNQQPAEVGALARHMVQECDGGRPLFRELTQGNRGNVEARIVARLMEIAEVVIAMERWARELAPNQPICNHEPMPKTAEGFGLMEAARGSLGHWIKVKKGRILNYQIIAPTTWNFSPRDKDGVPGPLEMALVGATMRAKDDEQPAMVQHIVRSFDPCMVCTVH